jgi:hypothetical protein
MAGAAKGPGVVVRVVGRLVGVAVAVRVATAVDVGVEVAGARTSTTPFIAVPPGKLWTLQ